MSGAADAIGGLVGGIGDAITGAVKAVGSVVSGIGNAITGAVSAIGNTVKNILKNPIPTLLQVGGAMIGIPPYVTAAAITAVQGGRLEDIAKSAAVSYATTSFLSDTQVGADIKNYTSNALSGDFTDNMMQKFNLTPDQAVQVAKVSSAALNSSIVGGINAAITGKPIGQGIASGFTSGLVYSSTDSFFDSVNKDPNWGFSQQALNLMKGATSTALNTIVSGKGDPAQAIGNYIAYAAINMGGSSLAQSAKDAYKLLTTDTEAAKAAQDKYTTLKADYDTKIADGEKLRNTINSDAAAYQKTVDEQFTPFKTKYDALIEQNTAAVNDFNTNKQIYDDNKWAYENYDAKMKQLGYEASPQEDGSTSYFKRSGGHWADLPDGEGGTYRAYVADSQSWNGEDYTSSIKYDWNAPSQQSFADKANAAATAANAAADKATTSGNAAQKLYDENKTMIEGLGTTKTAIDNKLADLQKIKDDVEKPNADGTNLAAKIKAASDDYQTKYDAWAKTKDAADRSAENYTKALAEVATRNATIDALNTGAIKATGKDADGNWTLSNGMTLTSQGKFMQDGQQVFTNAAGVPQAVLDFKAADGSKVDFNENAGRILSTSDVQNICRRDFGFTPTDEEAKSVAGGVYTNDVTAPINQLADKKAREAYFTVLGIDPSRAQMDSNELERIRKSGNVVNSAVDAAINGLDLPADYIFPDMSVQEKISRGQAYSAARAAYGPNAIFEWTDPKTGVTKQYTTENAEEKAARLAKAAEDAQNRINFMPASDVAGAGRGFLGGRPAGVENIYYGKKDDNVYVDTRTFDAMGNVTGGSLQLADDKTATNIRATNILSQMAATGAQGIGELMQNYANAVALATGSDMNNTVYKLGKAIEQWGADRDGEDVNTQTANIKAAIERAGKTGNMFDQVSIIAKAAKDNPLGFISDIGKEVVQETPGWALGAVAGGVMLTLGAGAGAVALTAAGISATLDGLESFGSGGREAYDALKKAGVPEDVAREKALINGAIHAAVTAPAEFVADKALFKAYLSSVSGGVKEYAAKYGSTIATNALSEFVEAVPQNVSTQLLTTGKVDLKAATAGAFYEGMIGGGTVTAMAGPAAINDAAIIAKDIYGNPVTLAEFTSGSKEVDLKTINSSAVIGQTANGAQLTMGAVTASGVDNGLSVNDLKLVLPSNLTDDSTVVGRAADGTSVTLGNINAMVAKNPTMSVSTILEDVYTLNATEFKSTFTPSVLSGSSAYQSMTDLETRAKAAGFPSYAAYTQYNGDSTAYNNAVNQNLATAAGFPDYATYTQYNGNKDAYKAALATTTGTGTTTTTGGGTTSTTGTGTTATTGSTTGTGVTTTGGGTTATTGTGATTATGTTTGTGATTGTGTNVATTGSTTTTGTGTTGTGATTGSTATTGSGATTGNVTMDAVTQAIQNAISGIQLPAGVSMDAVVTAIKNFAAANPQLTTTDVATAISDYMKSNPPVSMSDVNSAMTLATKGLATRADIAAAIASIKLPAGVTKEDVASAIETYMTAHPGVSATDVSTAVKSYMDTHPNVTAADVSTAITSATKDFATKTDIDNAIANIKFPPGITKSDVAAEIKTYMDAHPGVSATDVTNAITTYMQANPGVTASDVKTAVDNATKNLVTTDALTTALRGVSDDVKNKFDTLTDSQKTIIQNQVQQGKDLTQAINDASKATSEQITNVKTELKADISETQKTFNTRVDELMKQGQDYQTATQTALKELGGGIDQIKKEQEAVAAAKKAADEKARVQSSLASAAQLIAPIAGASMIDSSSPGFKDIGLKTTGEAKFESVLSPFQKMVKEESYAPRTQQQNEQQTMQQLQQAAPVSSDLTPPQNPQGGSDYFSYGTNTEIEDMLGSNPGTQMLYSKSGGLATPLMAGGGSTRYGRYAGGGLNIVEHSGKARVDFRHGDAVTGPGDGQSDDIPAMLADGEFVFPADVVAALGNGSTKAGSDKLYDMMHSIRAYHRSAKPEDLPPPAKKSPLDYLKKPRKARR